MPSSIERWIISYSLPILLVILVFGVLTEPSYTGMVESDGSYKSPVSDNSYKSPTSDNSYESPTVGSGYVAPKIDESWEAPKEGPGFQRPEVGPGFEKPEIGPGFIRPSTVNFTPDNQTAEKQKVKIEPGKLPKGPIDEKYVGGWRPYQLTNYFKEGGHKTARTPSDLTLNLHKDGTWTWGRDEGTWEVAEISDEDWKKWGIKADFQKKIIFYGWPYGGVQTTVDGPIEEQPESVDYIWAIYNAVPPAAPSPAQAWLRFAPGPYIQKEEELFSDLSLIGKWGIHAPSVVYKGRKGGGKGIGDEYEWEIKFPITTILLINEDKTWSWGPTKGTWKVLPIEDNDWKRWGREYYGPRKKLVLEGWENLAEGSNNSADGPIEASSGQVDFFWVFSLVKFDEQEAPEKLQLNFRPFETEETYLTIQLIGSGNVLTDDNLLSCLDTLGTAAPKQCSAKTNLNQEFELKAVSNNGWVFSGWDGACKENDAVCKVKMDRSKIAIAKFVPGCNDDSACASDQKCENLMCAPVQCDCGYAQYHKCQKYECCFKADCGEEQICDTRSHKCIAQSQCQELSINGDPSNKHDIVFVGDGFDDYAIFRQLLVYLIDYDGKYKGLLSVSPLKENRDKFNFWMVLAPDYQYWDDGEPVNEDIERFVKTCERDMVIVISRRTYRAYAFAPTSGSKGGVAYVSLGFAALRGTDFAAEYSGRLLLHEFGHAFGGLADEYVEYGKGTRRDLHLKPNCATTLEDAKAKWGDLVGFENVDFYTGIPNVPGTKYYKSPHPSIPEVGLFPDGSDVGDGGCSYDLKNIRPTIGSIMKLQIEMEYDFEHVNERELAKRLEEYK